MQFAKMKKNGLNGGKLNGKLSGKHVAMYDLNGNFIAEYPSTKELVEKMLEREPLPAPKLVINKDIKNFYDFTVDDFDLVGYEHGGSVGKIPVAI